MSYYSTVEVDATLEPTAELEEQTSEVISEYKKFATLGDKLPKIDSRSLPNLSAFTIMDNTIYEPARKALRELKDGIGYFYSISGDGILENDGAAGRIYNFKKDIEQLLDLLNSHDLILNGEITRYGESHEDAERAYIADGALTRISKGRLVFD